MAEPGIGTKAVFRSWLLKEHRLTYSAYTHLSPERKAEVWASYKKVKK